MAWQAAAAATAGSVLDYFSQQKANVANKKMAREQMNFQSKMSDTAHQREVEDLRKAGLNPLLSATGGSGASTPSGASTTVQPESLGNALRAGVSNAMSAQRLEADLNSIQENNKLTRAAVATKQTEAALNISNAKAAAANADRAATETARLNALLPSEKARAKFQHEKANIDSEMLKYDAIMNRVGTATGAVGNLLGVGKWFSWAKGAERLGRGTDRVIDSKTGEILQESRRRR